MNPLTLHGFAGNTTWIHRWLPHEGRPYWPGGLSGVVIDPGIDIGRDPWRLLHAYPVATFTHDELRHLQRCRGVRGEAAHDLITGDHILRGIAVPLEVARIAFPAVLRPYWIALERRYPAVLDLAPAAQTALLSLAQDRGPHADALTPLGRAIETRDYHALGGEIAAMQQRHRRDNVRRRRRAEAALVLSLVDGAEAQIT